MSDTVALKVSEIDVHYKDFQALWGVSIEAEKGKISSNTEVESVIELIDINIDRLNASVNNRTFFKEERRAKARTIQTWVTIIGIILSFIFSLLTYLKP